jgi:Acetyltransferase (GNAT) domain
MFGIPEAVRRQALHPFRELPVPSYLQLFDLDSAVVSIAPWQGPQGAILTSVETDVAAAVGASREIAREHGKNCVAWWLAPEYHPLAPAFEALGVVNKDAPGLEAVATAMALASEPVGERPEGVELRTVESFDDYRDAWRVVEAAFEYPAQSEEALRDLCAAYLEDTDDELFVAVIDGKLVATGAARRGKVGLNLFGGSVLEEARGRGLYRALTFARWDRAVALGKPALTVQCGAMSKPICERLGFESVGEIHVYVDELVGAL